jgi:hypothetical protein
MEYFLIEPFKNWMCINDQWNITKSWRSIHIHRASRFVVIPHCKLVMNVTCVATINTMKQWPLVQMQNPCDYKNNKGREELWNQMGNQKNYMNHNW